jgi:hypothetical protein
MLIRWKSLRGLAAVLGLTALVAACDDDPLVQPPDNGTAEIRVIHGSPDAPMVDIYVEGSATPVFEDLAYGDASAYATVDAGTYNVQIRAAGADPASAPVFETGNITLQTGDDLTALAAGLLASNDPADQFRVLALYEDFVTPAAGNAVVRVVHASPDAPTVDIDVLNDGSSEIVDLARFEDTGSMGIELPGGSPLLVGILVDDALFTTFTTPPLAEGTDYYLIADGLVGQTDPMAADAFKLLAVDENGSSSFIAQNGPDAGSVRLRAVHASPDAPSVDVYVEGLANPIITALTYGDASLYFPVDPGTYNVQLRAHPSTDADPIAYETGPVELAANQTVTAVASGFLSSDDPADEFRILPLIEDFGAGTGALVRIVHAGPDAPSVDIDVGDDGASEIEDLARFADTGMTGIGLPAGESLQIAIREAGGDRVTAFTTPALPSDELFVIATGSLVEPARAEDGFSLLVVGPEGSLGFLKQNPVVYALHGSPDAPPVDIYAGETLLVENIAFGELSAAVQVPPADFYVLDFYPTGTAPGAPTASFQTPALAAGSGYLAVAAGELAPEDTDEEFTLLAFEELFETTDVSRVRAVHASGDAPPVDIGSVDSATGDLSVVVFENLAFGEASADVGAELPVGDLTLGVAPTGNATPAATFDVTTTAGLQTFAVAIGSLAPDAGDASFRLILVVASANPWIGAEVLPNS